ncbi:MAG: DUF2897 family protein [Marinobacter sp.]|nr:DUF2897 family protein [Marinobacter sp.]
MPTIGWIFILLAIGMVLGSLMLLRDTANSMPISKDKLKKIRQRQAELEAEEEQKSGRD